MLNYFNYNKLITGQLNKMELMAGRCGNKRDTQWIIFLIILTTCPGSVCLLRFNSDPKCLEEISAPLCDATSHNAANERACDVT